MPDTVIYNDSGRNAGQKKANLPTGLAAQLPALQSYPDKYVGLQKGQTFPLSFSPPIFLIFFSFH